MAAANKKIAELAKELEEWKNRVMDLEEKLAGLENTVQNHSDLIHTPKDGIHYDLKKWETKNVVLMLLERKCVNLNLSKTADTKAKVSFDLGRQLLVVCLHCLRDAKDPEVALAFNAAGCISHRKNHQCSVQISPTGTETHKTADGKSQTHPTFDLPKDHREKRDFAYCRIPGLFKVVQLGATKPGCKNGQWRVETDPAEIVLNGTYAPDDYYRYLMERTQDGYYTGVKQVSDDYSDDLRAIEAEKKPVTEDDQEILLGTAEADGWTPASPQGSVHSSSEDSSSDAEEQAEQQLTPAPPAVAEAVPKKPKKRPIPTKAPTQRKK